MARAGPARRASRAGLRQRGRSRQRLYAAVGRAADGTLTDSVHPPSTETGPRGPRQADDAVAAVAFELTQVLLDAVRRAGSSQRSDVNDALVGTRGAVAGREVRFSGDHTSRVPHELAVWRDGRLVPVVP